LSLRRWACRIPRADVERDSFSSKLSPLCQWGETGRKDEKRTMILSWFAFATYSPVLACASSSLSNPYIHTDRRTSLQEEGWASFRRSWSLRNPAVGFSRGVGGLVRFELGLSEWGGVGILGQRLVVVVVPRPSSLPLPHRPLPLPRRPIRRVMVVLVPCRCRPGPSLA